MLQYIHIQRIFPPLLSSGHVNNNGSSGVSNAEFKAFNLEVWENREKQSTATTRSISTYELSELSFCGEKKKDEEGNL